MCARIAASITPLIISSIIRAQRQLKLSGYTTSHTIITSLHHQILRCPCPGQEAKRCTLGEANDRRMTRGKTQLRRGKKYEDEITSPLVRRLTCAAIIPALSVPSPCTVLRHRDQRHQSLIHHSIFPESGPMRVHHSLVHAHLSRAGPRIMHCSQNV